VGEFVERAFQRAGLDWNRHVVIDEALFRPAEVDLLVGSPDKASRALRWKPKVTFHGLVDMMVDADITLVGEELNGIAKRGRG
jgi:GDPmannose 4,6-dehydratase